MLGPSRSGFARVFTKVLEVTNLEGRIQTKVRVRGRVDRLVMSFYGIWLWLTLWLFNIAMENCPFIDDFSSKTSIYKGFSMAIVK